MKIRRGFVTNSSSSSFVIATRIGMKKEDIEKELEKMIPAEELDAFWSNWEAYAADDESRDSIIPEMADFIYSETNYGTPLFDGFKVSAATLYDDGEMIGQSAICVLQGYLNGESVKVVET